MLSNASLSTSVDAAKAITIADSAANQITLIRGDISAYMKQLEFANLVHTNQYTEKAIGLATLQDADVALEAARVAKAQMLKQIALAVQSQMLNEGNQIIDLIKSLRLAA